MPKEIYTKPWTSDNFIPRDRVYGLDPFTARTIERERQRPVTQEDLRRKRDIARLGKMIEGPLRLIGQALEAKATRVLSWSPLMTFYEYLELSPEELGEREKGRILALLEESGVGQRLTDEEALILQRSTEELGNFGDNTVTWNIDIALQNDGVYRFGRLGVEGQEGFTTLTSRPIPVGDYPLYSDLVDAVVQNRFETQKPI